MADVFDAEYVSLHVRVTNKGAFHLYTRTLGYECVPSRPDRSSALPWSGMRKPCLSCGRRCSPHGR